MMKIKPFPHYIPLTRRSWFGRLVRVPALWLSLYRLTVRDVGWYDVRRRVECAIAASHSAVLLLKRH